MKWLTLLLASLTILSGAITFWLPIPTGLPLLMVGVTMLIRSSPRARRKLHHLSRCHPVLQRLLRRLGEERQS